MEEEYKDNSFLFSILFIIFIMIVLMGGSWSLYRNDIKYKNNGCLIEIGKKVCEERGLRFVEVHSTVFHCAEDERKKFTDIFMILDRDFEECGLK